MRLEVSGLTLLSGEHDDGLALGEGAVQVQLVPSNNPDVPTTSIAVVMSIEPPVSVGHELKQRWPRLVAEEREFVRSMQGPPPPLGKLKPLKIGPTMGWLLFNGDPVLAQFFAEARHDVRACATRLVGLLSWHFDMPLLGQSVDRARIEWSLDGSEWISDHDFRPQSFSEAEDVGSWGAEVESGDGLVADLLESYGEGAPLARELFTEAVRLMAESARSSLVVAVTAAEVAARSFASSRGKVDAAWLLSRPQAPPLDDLLKNYLPFLTDTRTRRGAVIPTELRKIVRRGIEARNKVVHFGEPGLADEELYAVVTAVNDLLYILDWLGGEQWAIGLVSSQWRDEYDLEDQTG